MHYCIIGFYINDMLITWETFEIISINYKIKNIFKVSKCNPADIILGIKIERDNNDIYIS